MADAERLEALEADVAKVRERCERLERVVQQQQETIARLAALLGPACPVPEQHRPPDSEAFVRDVDKLPPVQALAHAPVSCVGPVHVGGPVRVPGGETMSSSGVMATVTRAGELVWTDAGARAIHVLNLWTGARDQVACLPEAAFVCARAERLVVGVWRAEQVLEGDVGRLLLARSLDSFRVHRVPAIGHPACRTDAAPGLGWVLYRGPGWRPVQLDLDSFEWRVLDSVGEVTRLSSLLGFQARNVLGVVEKENHAKMLMDDGEELELGELSRPISWCCVFSDEKDKDGWSKETLQASTMVVDTEGNATMNGKQFALGFKPCPSQGVVRLTDNILLVLDTATWHWVAISLSI